ncbi:MAG: hypothetical protein K2K30_02970 [Alistipes sp.]|nr:hypothetical protein [Alistipes sp.]MDE6623337.1 hypothetical protein [Alistipes sp.]
MMKKMKQLLLAALALCVCAACNDELGPEYSTYPSFSDFTYTPRFVTADDTVDVSVDITSEYGLSAAWVVYCLNDDLSTSKTSGRWLYKGDSDKSVTFVAKDAIPQQPAGTKVTFQVQAQTPYGVIGFTQLYSYTVEEGSEAMPDVPEIDEN